VTKTLLGCEPKLADTVVTFARNTLDGLLMPVRGEIPANLGRSYCNITWRGAAIVMIEFQAERVLLVDGATQKVGTFDPRVPK
jgi:hypothetical protein